MQPTYKPPMPPSLAGLLERVRIDFAPPARQPGAARLVAATVMAVVGSLAADALLVAIGTAVFPATKGYTHFRFGDYATLTVIGVLIACAGWPVVTRISSSPRLVFLRLAIAVTLVLWLPDVWLLVRGQPAKAVGVLMVMHLAIAVVTYSALVLLAPAGRRGRPAGPERPGAGLLGDSVRVR